MDKFIKKRNYNIDLIKLIACLGVVCLHVFHAYIEQSSIYIYIYNLGVVSIPFFFMASGYFMLNRTVNWKFIIRKIINIIIFVTVWGTIFWVIYGVIDHNWSLYEWLKNVLGSYIQKGDLYQFWFLGSLIMMNLLSPLLIQWKQKFPTIYKLFLIFILLIGIILSYNDLIHHTVFEHTINQTFRLWIWLAYFMLGGELKKVENIFKGQSNSILYLLIIFISMIASYSTAIIEKIQNNTYAEFAYDNIVIYLCSILLFLCFTGVTLNNKSIKIIKQIYPLTLSVYIIHPFIIKCIHHFNILNQSAFLVYIITIILSFLFAYVMQYIWLIRKIKI